jgi:hypothetical protein
MKTARYALGLLLAAPLATSAYALTESETADLLFIREEEKLARDVYLEMDELWTHRVFANIAQSEQRHMDSMLAMIDLYELNDPVGDNERGEFTNSDLGAWYGELIADGSQSLLDAFAVGALIEETDLRDLTLAIENTAEAPLIRAYTNLRAGSCNHLRAFVSHIVNLEGGYEPQVLTAQQYADCVEGFEGLPVGDGQFSINPGLNDSWYDPATNGQGFAITVFPGTRQVLVNWFTYDTELAPGDATSTIGHPGQRWMSAQGNYSGSLAELQVFSLDGGLFDSEEPKPTMIPMGSILLQFDSCSSGSVTYDIPTGTELPNLSDSIPIQRINSDNVAMCQQQGGNGGNGP